MKGIAITPHAGGESSSPTYAPSSLRGRVLAFTLFAIIALLLTGGLAQRASAADRNAADRGRPCRACTARTRAGPYGRYGRAK